MGDVAAIILAAGLSRRMGARNKLLLPVGRVPMIRHMVDTYRAIVTHSVLVVTGHEATEIEAALAGRGATTLFNPDFADGQPTSVACGLRAADGVETMVIGLGDQPLLTGGDLRALLARLLHSQVAAQAPPALASGRRQGYRLWTVSWKNLTRCKRCARPAVHHCPLMSSDAHRQHLNKGLTARLLHWS